MARRWLADLVEGYRWLWSAQRRWYRGSRWLSVPFFMARVFADIMRSVVPSRLPRLRARHLAVASLFLIAALFVDAQRRADRRPVGDPITWADTTGGFEVVFPAGWSRETDARERDRPTVAGSAHQRPAGGTLLRRHLTARAFDLGVIPPGVTTKSLAALASGIRAPGETLVRPALARQGVYVTAYRSAVRGDGGSNAAIFFRGRDGHGFMLEITGHRDDETLVIDQAFAIADSLRHEQTVLSDMAILLAQAFLVPTEALEQARAMEVDAERARAMEADFGILRPSSIPAGQARARAPFVVNANPFLDTGTGTARDDECRARAVLLFSSGSPAALGIMGPPREFRMTCQTSTVAIGPDLGMPPRIVLRQLDLAGEPIYEESVSLEALFVGG